MLQSSAAPFDLSECRRAGSMSPRSGRATSDAAPRALTSTAGRQGGALDAASSITGSVGRHARGLSSDDLQPPALSTRRTTRRTSRRSPSSRCFISTGPSRRCPKFIQNLVLPSRGGHPDREQGRLLRGRCHDIKEKKPFENCRQAGFGRARRVRGHLRPHAPGDPRFHGPGRRGGPLVPRAGGAVQGGRRRGPRGGQEHLEPLRRSRGHSPRSSATRISRPATSAPRVGSGDGPVHRHHGRVGPGQRRRADVHATAILAQALRRRPRFPSAPSASPRRRDVEIMMILDRSGSMGSRAEDDGPEKGGQRASSTILRGHAGPTTGWGSSASPTTVTVDCRPGDQFRRPHDERRSTP